MRFRNCSKTKLKEAAMRLAKYVSVPLRQHEVGKLINQFFELELSKGARIEITPTDIPSAHATHKVIITAMNEGWNEIVHATFRDGIMSHWGWDKKFTDYSDPVEPPA